MPQPVADRLADEVTDHAVVLPDVGAGATVRSDGGPGFGNFQIETFLVENNVGIH